jgi:hypothetical protein
MATEIRVDGVKEFGRAIMAMNVRANEAMRKFVVEGGRIVTKNARREFTTVVENAQGVQGVLERGLRAGVGRRIVRRGRNLSGAGGPPHIRSGTLARSIQTRDVKQEGFGRWTSNTGPTTVYGRRVELGFRGVDAKGRHFDEPKPFHPYLAPGLKASMTQLEELYQIKVREALRG